ncbi:MAG TPA: substrate-binding domain-containing protein [Spirochaetia bacterium]|nr:substrate-binding domain-containing protein [Spirochaetia bacterium]
MHNRSSLSTILGPAALLLMAASIISCGPPAQDTTGTEYLIGMSQANLTEPWRIVMNAEIHDEAVLHKNIRVIFTDADDSTQKQISDVQKLVDYGIDLLIISPTDAEALTPVVTRVYQKIPVIVLDRAVEGYDYTLFIGPDNWGIGNQAGKYVRDLLGAKGGRVFEIQGRSGSPPVLDRSLGFRAAISKATNITMVGTSVADWMRDKAEDTFAEQLKDRAPADIVFAQNDPMAYGAYLAARKAGMKNIRFIGVDGLPGPLGGIDLVKKGILTATFSSPTGGREAIRYAIDILNHAEGIPKKIFVRAQRITKNDLEKAQHAVPVAATAGSSKRIVMGFAQVGTESEWRVANTKSIKDAAKKFGIDLRFVNSQQKPENQIKAIRSFIAQKVDVIAFSPIVESGWDEVLNEAKEAGIPVFITDRAVDTRDDSLWVTFMGSDFVEEGRRAARWLLKYLHTDAPVNIAEELGTIGSAPAIDREKGFAEVLKDHPNYRIILSEGGDFTVEGGRDVMRKFLRESGRRIDAVFAHNDDMALGAIQAIKEYGLKPGKDITIVSVDAARGAFEAMMKGELNCTVECNPLLGDQLMKAVTDYMSGKELPTRMITDERVFPASEAAKVLPSRKY